MLFYLFYVCLVCLPFCLSDMNSVAVLHIIDVWLPLCVIEFQVAHLDVAGDCLSDTDFP